MRNWAKSRKNRPRGSMAAGQAKPVLTLIMLYYFPNTAIINKTAALPIRRPPSVIALNQQTEPTNSMKPPPLSLSNQSCQQRLGLDFCLSTLLDTHTRHGAVQRLFLPTSRQESRAAATSLEPISTGTGLQGSGHSEPSRGSDMGAAPACSRQTPGLQGTSLASLSCCQGHF